MNRTQKAAIYGLYLGLFLLMIPLGDFIETKINPILLRVIGYPMAILMVAPVWFLKKKEKSQVDMDERDKAIVKKALISSLITIIAGLLILYVIYVMVLSPDHLITASTLQGVVFFGFTAFILIFSSLILIQYRFVYHEENKDV